MKFTFNNVWYRPAPRGWKDLFTLAFCDIGTLDVYEDHIEFSGSNGKVTVDNISKISYARKGTDLANNWVCFEYSGKISAMFADGNDSGWGGIFGGTKEILKAVQHLNPVKKTRGH